MSSITDKSTIILNQETQFAKKLAGRIMNKPELSVWMILIPIIFVFYFYQLQRFTAAKKAFVENYLISVKRALAAVTGLIESGREPDFAQLAQETELPQESAAAQIELFVCFSEQIHKLLKAKGKTYEKLVRSAYKEAAGFKLGLGQLQQCEQKLNESLKLKMSEEHEEISNTITKIEVASQQLRNELVDAVFC